MAQVSDTTTVFGLKQTGLLGTIIELRCTTCGCRYFAPAGEEQTIKCDAPGCVAKKRAE